MSKSVTNRQQSNREFWEVSAPGIATLLNEIENVNESTKSSGDKTGDTIRRLETFIDGACSALDEVKNTISSSIVDGRDDFSVNNVVTSTPVEINNTRRVTRSCGPVPSYTNVQSRTLERKRYIRN